MISLIVTLSTCSPLEGRLDHLFEYPDRIWQDRKEVRRAFDSCWDGDGSGGL